MSYAQDGISYARSTTGQQTMPNTWRSRLMRYGIAVAATLLATLLRAALAPVLKDHAPFAVYYVAILFTAWYCGLGPSLLATVAGGMVGS